MTTQLVERMAVELDGQGAPVVLVHGLGGTSNFFTPQVMALAERYRTIRPDLPGSGRSPAWEKTSIQIFVDALVRLLSALSLDGAAHRTPAVVVHDDQAGHQRTARRPARVAARTGR